MRSCHRCNLGTAPRSVIGSACADCIRSTKRGSWTPTDPSTWRQRIARARRLTFKPTYPTRADRLMIAMYRSTVQMVENRMWAQFGPQRGFEAQLGPQRQLGCTETLRSIRRRMCTDD